VLLRKRGDINENEDEDGDGDGASGNDLLASCMTEMTDEMKRDEEMRNGLHVCRQCRGTPRREFK